MCAYCIGLLIMKEKKPAMGYIYEAMAMDRATEAIQNVFNRDEDKYKDIFSIIDGRWECQLHHRLHAVGHYLNPVFFYSNPIIDLDHKVMEGFYKCIERLGANDEVVDKASNEVSKYKRAVSFFRMIGVNVATLSSLRRV